MNIENNEFPADCANNWHITIIRLHIYCLIVLLAGCLPSSSSKPKLLLWEHQLVGKIWDVKQQAFIDQATLTNSILENEYLLLGERHDNLVHHQHQTWVIQQLAKAGRQASIAFEMIDNYQGTRLAKQRITTADQLIAVLNRSKTNWNYEQRYKSIFSEALAAGYQINSANLNSKRLMHTVKQGEDKLPAAYKRMLSRTPLSKQQLNSLQQVINKSHCNMLDDKTSQKMVLGQRLRDAIMAHSLLKSKAQIKVLIAGNGHVHNDRAVPLYLRTNLAALAKEPRILTIGFVEVEAGITDISAYAEHLDSDTLPYDIAWFTPQVEREDACSVLRQHFKKKAE